MNYTYPVSIPIFHNYIYIFVYSLIGPYDVNTFFTRWLDKKFSFILQVFFDSFWINFSFLLMTNFYLTVTQNVKL